MIRAGLTGGIGSGKTTVAGVLELLGVPVYYADERGRWLSGHDPEVVLQIKALFGENAYAEDGTFNRKYIAEKVFSDRSLLERLNRIVHPAVRKDYREWAALHSDAVYTVMESAILMESGFDSEVDKIIVATAPESVRIARTVLRDGVSAEAVKARIAAQISDGRRLEKADFILDSGEKQLLIPQIIDLHGKLMQDTL